MNNYVAFQSINSNRSGKWCWNSEVGCKSQIDALKFIGFGVLILFGIFAVVAVLSHISSGPK